MTRVELDPDAVRLSLNDGMTMVTLDAPTVRSTLTVEVTVGMCGTLDPPPDAARRVIIRGSDEAGAFYADDDVNTMHELQADVITPPETVDHVVHDTTNCMRRACECDPPAVAAVDGPTVDAGAVLAIACSLQLLRDDAAVGSGFRRVGLAVDSGVSYLLPRLIRHNIAMELVYTGEELGPSRALELGVVNRVVGTDEFEVELVALAERIADDPTKTLTASKHLLHRPDDSIEATTEHEASAQTVIFETNNYTEGVALFANRRRPEFEGM